MTETITRYTPKHTESWDDMPNPAKIAAANWPEILGLYDRLASLHIQDGRAVRCETSRESTDDVFYPAANCTLEAGYRGLDDMNATPMSDRKRALNDAIVERAILLASRKPRHMA